jgi:glycosyltransferase involved in cell wall biosynthesis
MLIEGAARLEKRTRLRVASVISSIRSGGIGPVCRYAAQAIARQRGWEVTLLSLIDTPGAFNSEVGNLRTCGLNLTEDCAKGLLRWLEENPQDVLITNSVSEFEPAFPYLPADLFHIVQVHDSGKRYRGVATQYAPYLDGVVCVARHIEERLAVELPRHHFQGLLDTVHNGADFPESSRPNVRRANDDLQLLFMGSLDPIKGVTDLVPILRETRKRGVPVKLHIVGGVDEHLRRTIERAGLSAMVTWHGRVPHEQCYNLAAQADVSLMLSRKEPFGMVVIEAMSMGCIPIAYDVPAGPKEILVDRENGLLVRLGDTRAVATMLAELYFDPALRLRLSEAASKRARLLFNADRMGDQLAEFIARVVARGPARPVKRLSGKPPVTVRTMAAPRRGYSRLPETWRIAIRRSVGSQAHLCHWLLDR